MALSTEELSSRVFFSKRFPSVWEGFQALRHATGAGPAFDRKTTELLSLALHTASRARVGVQLHALRAQDAGATEAEIYSVVLLNLGVTTGVTQVQEMVLWVDEALGRTEANT